MNDISPALVRNDMLAHAIFWEKRDRKIGRACRDAARVIQMMLDGTRVDGRTYGGLHMRLLDLGYSGRNGRLTAYPNFDRARSCIERLNAETRERLIQRREHD